MSVRTSQIATHEASAAAHGERDKCVTAETYSCVEEEYRCVRERVGLQDLSHYGKIAVSGDAALDLVNYLILTDLARLPINQLQSSFMLDDDGRPVCELLIANMGSYYLLLSEGADPETVAQRLHAVADRFPGATIENQTDARGLLSVDGPYAWELLKTFLGLGVIGTRYLEVVPNQMIGGVEVTLCRAGKTGEYGYMLLSKAADTVALWDALKAAGERFSLLPVGYRTIDVCKLENRNISQHNEGAAASNVLELNTRVMLGRDKEEHVGRDALLSVMQNGLSRRLVGVTFDDTLPAALESIAPGVSVSLGCRPVGTMVNTAWSFTLNRWIGLALIEEELACVGVEYDVQTPVGPLTAATVSAPFLFNKSLSIRPQEDSYFA